MASSLFDGRVCRVLSLNRTMSRPYQIDCSLVLCCDHGRVTSVHN